MTADGEGAEHLVKLHVSGPYSSRPAAPSARQPHHLRKTTFYGKDPNCKAPGRRREAGVEFDPSKARLVEGIAIVRHTQARARGRGTPGP